MERFIEILWEIEFNLINILENLNSLLNLWETASAGLQIVPTQKLPLRDQLPSVLQIILAGDEKSVHRYPSRQIRLKMAPSGETDGTPPATVSFRPKIVDGSLQGFPVSIIQIKINYFEMISDIL